MQQQENRRQYQLTSIDQALMDELVGRVRDCYRQMTEIAMRAMNEDPGADMTKGNAAGSPDDGADPFHDEEVRWWMGPGQELCYRKNGGKVEVRPAR
ncbi:hypothetical protein C8P63_10624 [Melghirimyces profundicolus]|uniref:Uncharacterized protein n=1 Tax=Melghirimyces profundicolus TaxID=1242148 RepID=A0A2T6C0E3_9BACL|nr:hypothetical protein [Melghirimyces profundicolus]PTX61772.1 hypothetical protein C8P63_10624 [Melghirimyces profundicolus]